MRVALDGVGVSGARVCPYPLLRPLPVFDLEGCGFVGTAVCVELLDADELEGVGEDGREGVGVTVEEEDSVCRLVVLDDRWAEVGDAGIGLSVVGAGGAVAGGDGGGCSRISDARCCSCRDARDVARRCAANQQLD